LVFIFSNIGFKTWVRHSIQVQFCSIVTNPVFLSFYAICPMFHIFGSVKDSVGIQLLLWLFQLERPIFTGRTESNTMKHADNHVNSDFINN